MKHREIKTIAVLLFIFVVRVYVSTNGPLDTYPHVFQTIKSADGAWELEVYLRKLSPLNPFAVSELGFRIKDIKGGRVSEQEINRGPWASFIGDSYKVRFEPTIIIVNDFWVADKVSLTFRMCPLLECLNKVE